MTYLTFGGLKNSDTGTTAAWAAVFEAGRGVRLSGQRVIRGLEADFNLTERGYHFFPATRVLIAAPRVIIYLPRDWTLALRGGAIRTTVAGANRSTPVAGASLNMPVTRRLSLAPAVAFDSEIADVLQLHNISSRTFGGGARFWLSDRTTASAYYSRVLYGSNHLANNAYGVFYALRF